MPAWTQDLSIYGLSISASVLFGVVKETKDVAHVSVLQAEKNLFGKLTQSFL